MKVGHNIRQYERGEKMPKIATTKQSIQKNTIQKMKDLGHYRDEYDDLIGVYSDLLEQYLQATKDFKEGGFQYETETSAGTLKKSAIVNILENLRKDLVIYSDRLMLNPKMNYNKQVTQEEESPLAKMLRSMGH